ncbi:MAG: ABC transporter permease [Ardenticatenaceae bacterium]|nr:ABC transporter permease [Ardenticatenaceae bacterium]
MVVRYIARRLALLVPVLLGISLFVFSLIRFAPGDPVHAALGMDYDPKLAAEMKRELGLDKPIPQQYVWWVGRAIRGDLGRSIVAGETVQALIRSRLPTTLLLSLGSMVVALLIAVPLGIVSAVYKDSLIDNVSRLLAMIGISMPVFWLGILLLIAFALKLKWFPATGSLQENGLKAMVLPSIALGASFAALITRMVRSTMVDVLVEDYIRTARAKGLRSRAIYLKHAFKNAMIPVITVVGMQFGLLLSGAVLTETIFNLPGLGRLLVEAVSRRDYPLIQGVILVTSLIFVFANLLVDVIYLIVDPRIRYE